MWKLIGLKILATSPALAAAASLSFIEPSTISGGQLDYRVGEQVNITWTTPYEFTNLKVLQGPLENGGYTEMLLAYNWPQDYTQTMWKAVRLSNSNAPFHFQLQKGVEPNECDECTASSPMFYIGHAPNVPASQTSRTVAPSMTSSSTPKPSSSSTMKTETSSMATQTPSSMSSVAVGSATASPSPAPALSSSNKHSRDIGLGVGLGLGIPILLALIAGIFFVMRRRRRSEEPQFEPPVQETAEVQDGMYEPSAGMYEPSATMSRMSRASQLSYHEPFEFQAADGSVREGSERLFSNDEGRQWARRWNSLVRR